MVTVRPGGGVMPKSDAVPEALSDLTARQAIQLDDVTRSVDVERLLDRLQLDYFARLRAGEAADALDLAQKTLATFDRISPVYPGNVYMQAVRGYSHKNCARALLSLPRDDDASEQLVTSDQVFTPCSTSTRPTRTDEMASAACWRYRVNFKSRFRTSSAPSS
ncbi:MAG: hypothetical protein ACXVFQ_01600 [Solirubrobacteraceae bacterium]